MAPPRESALQRIQVGIFGIVLVLIVISIANVMYTRAARQEAPVTQSEEPEQMAAEKDAVPDEPLAELGVAPAVEAEPVTEDGEPIPDAELDGPNTAPVE
ncbi:MAG: hypothetical protein V3V15_11340 [Sphingorhabdus sp.]